MDKKIVTAFLLIVGFCLSGQEATDSLGVVYGSDFEKKYFGRIYQNDNEENFIEALLAIDSTVTDEESNKINNQINAFLVELKDKAESYSPKKKVKYIFNKVHDRFFRKYELNAYFSDIFKTATYNCVSGTALYAHTFDFMDVPYQIKETPTHVFLVAYPNQYNIYVETTLPGKAGSYAPSEFLIKKAVDDLVKMKIVTSEHVNTIGYNKAYNEYYYGNENITKKDLVGIQYYNKGIFLLNAADYEKAYENMRKSKLVYKNEKLKIFNEGILAIMLDEADFSKLENFKWFMEYVKIGDDVDFLTYKLYAILSNQNWSDEDLKTIEAKLLSIKNEGHRNKLLETNYSYLAEKAHKFQRTSEALFYAEKVYALNQDNIDAKNYIATSEIDKLARKNITASRLDDLDDLVAKYPFLLEFGIYYRYQVYLYSFLAANSYHNNKGDDGANYLERLEKIISEGKDGSLDFNQEAIGNAYGEAGAYFYRKGQKESSKKMLNRGLEFSPDNENIKRKLRLIKESH